MERSNVRLVAFRKSRGLRQVDLALKTGLAPATIWLAEHGRDISLFSKRKIAAALDVGISDVFEDGA